MREVVHGIDAPYVAGAMVGRVPNPVERRIPQVQVWRRHVDFRSEYVRAVLELAASHAREQIEVFLDGSIAIRAVAARLGERPAILANLVGLEAVDVRLAVLDQLDRKLIQRLEVIRRVQQRVPGKPEPFDVFLDGVDILDILRGRIGVVEPKVAHPAGLLRDAEVQTDGLGVPDVQVAVGLGGKPRGDAAVVFSGRQVVGHDRPNEIDRGRRGDRGVLFGVTRGHDSRLFYQSFTSACRMPMVKSPACATRRSAADRSWRSVSQCGIAIVFIPAARADAIPGPESSMAIDRAGATPSRRAASRYTSGAGFLRVTSSAVTMVLKRSRRPARSTAATTQRAGEVDAIAVGTAASARASTS